MSAYAKTVVAYTDDELVERIISAHAELVELKSERIYLRDRGFGAFELPIRRIYTATTTLNTKLKLMTAEAAKRGIKV